MAKEVSVDLIQALKRYKNYFYTAAILSAGVIVYLNTFRNEFVWDDESLIVIARYIKSFRYISEIFRTGLLHDLGVISSFYRPLQVFTFTIDYHLWGLDPAGYHFANLLFHISASVLIYYFILKVSKDRAVSLLSALFFVVHPIHTEAVTYISGRADSMSLVFVLSTFLLLLKFKETKQVYLYILSMASFILALLSKEMSMIFIPLLVLYYLIYEKENGLKKALVLALKMALPFIALIGLYILARHTVITINNINTDVTPAPFYERMITVPRVIVDYIGLLLFPVNLHMERMMDTLKTLYDPKFWIPAGTLCVLSVSLKRCIEKKDKDILFASGWFLIGLFPVLNIFPLKAIIAEHWVYLPSVGFFFLVSTGIVRLARRLSPASAGRIMLPFVVIFALIFYSIATVRQNARWQNGISLYSHILRFSPKSPSVHFNLGNAYQKVGDLKSAETEYRESFRLDPNKADAHNNLGNVYFLQGRIDEAIAEFKAAIRLNPQFYLAVNNLAKIYAARGEFKESVHLYEWMIGRDPKDTLNFIILADIYDRAGRYDEAEELLVRAIAHSGWNADLHNSLGIAYGKNGKVGGAIEEYLTAIRLDPNLSRAYNNLGTAYMSNGDFDRAVKAYNKCIELTPRYAGAFYNLANAYLSNGLLDDARRSYKMAAELDPSLKPPEGMFK